MAFRRAGGPNTIETHIKIAGPRDPLLARSAYDWAAALPVQHWLGANSAQITVNATFQLTSTHYRRQRTKIERHDRTTSEMELYNCTLFTIIVVNLCDLCERKLLQLKVAAHRTNARMDGVNESITDAPLEPPRTTSNAEGAAANGAGDAAAASSSVRASCITIARH